MKKDSSNKELLFEFNDTDLQELFEPLRTTEKMREDKFHYPIILAHGFARPDFLVDNMFRTLNLSIYDLSFVADRFHYFKGIASHLRENGFDVHHSRVSWAASVDTRAIDLEGEVKRILAETGAHKVHIIAHSMGGLDARHMLVTNGMAKKVASLTTLGTPHLGSRIADILVEQGIDQILGIFRSFINLEGLSSITTDVCAAFNEAHEKEEAENDVIYQTYYSHQTLDRVFVPFQVAWKILNKHEGKSDGLVSIKSQKWKPELKGRRGIVKNVGQLKFPILADHLDQVGWWNLNEFHKAGWWNMKALREKNKHEEIIQDLYLKIANKIYKLSNSIQQEI